MNTFDAIMIAEGVEPATMDEKQAAWQHLIDTGLCWQLQGFLRWNTIGLMSAPIGCCG